MLGFEIIFIAGVHGVGKSHLCSQIENALGLPIFSASQLIREEKQAEIDINKKVIDAKENQDHLISALRNIKTDSKIIILDGHFCLFSDEGIINIPEKTFDNMPIKSIFVLYDYPENIYKRTKDRDGDSLSVEIISELQKIEIERAKFIANLIKVPFDKIYFCDTAYSIDRIKYLITK
jgi:adenylate kinase